MFFLFKNIGERIKTFVKIIYAIEVILGILACIIVPIIFFIEQGTFLLFLLLLAIPLIPIIFWLICFPLYAFGELVDGVQAIREQLSQDSGKNSNSQPAPQTYPATAPAQDYGYQSYQTYNAPDNTYNN